MLSFQNIALKDVRLGLVTGDCANSTPEAWLSSPGKGEGVFLETWRSQGSIVESASSSVSSDEYPLCVKFVQQQVVTLDSLLSLRVYVSSTTLSCGTLCSRTGGQTDLK